MVDDVNFVYHKRVSNVRQKLGRNIAKLRLKKEITQEKLAEATEYSVNQIASIENGRRSPSLEGLEKIAIVLDLEIWELFYFGP